MKWKMPFQTDKEIKANRPAIVVKGKKERTSIERNVSTERNNSIKMKENLLKYKDFEVDTERVWGMTTMKWAEKGMEKCISEITGNILIQEIQKCFLLGTAHILRRIFSIK